MRRFNVWREISSTMRECVPAYLLLARHGAPNDGEGTPQFSHDLVAGGISWPFYRDIPSSRILSQHSALCSVALKCPRQRRNLAAACNLFSRGAASKCVDLHTSMRNADTSKTMVLDTLRHLKPALMAVKRSAECEKHAI